jgi:hypothetical protein
MLCVGFDLRPYNKYLHTPPGGRLSGKGAKNRLRMAGGGFSRIAVGEFIYGSGAKMASDDSRGVFSSGKPKML